MSYKQIQTRIIFGLKVRQLRTEKGLSFVELSERTGMSVSYLNEIEKGKKYPKDDKIALLARVLHCTPDELTSHELSRGLAPVGELLRSNFLSELPLELFGIELAKVVELIADAPARVGAFISAIVEIARNYALREDAFYFAAMRAYQELHNNYFDDIEAAVDRFCGRYGIDAARPVADTVLAGLLRSEYQYTLAEGGLDAWPELRDFRSVFVPSRRELLLNSRLSPSQRAFQFGKELAFNYLDLRDRAQTSTLVRASGFDQVLNNFKATYFSVALLVNREAFVRDLRDFFALSRWEPGRIAALLDRYGVSPEILLQRGNVLPRFFGLDKLFFFRIIHDTGRGTLSMDKELHLNSRHFPHANNIEEHYCRRWISISLLEDLAGMQQEGRAGAPLIGIQRSRYHGTGEEYLCITIARPAGATMPGRNVSVTIGIRVDAALYDAVRFAADPAIPDREVNVTCERCPVAGCAERAAPPVRVEERARRQRVQDVLQRLQ